MTDSREFHRQRRPDSGFSGSFVGPGEMSLSPEEPQRSDPDGTVSPAPRAPSPAPKAAGGEAGWRLGGGADLVKG
jgi:hypothetical protein